MTRLQVDGGTTLVEAVVAIGILAGAVVALAGLAAIAVGTAARARERSTAAILAFQKMEAICRDAAGLPISPPDAWASDTAGFVEHLDASGEHVAAGRGGVFVRRWSVAPLPSDANLLAIQVDVAPCRSPPGSARCGDTAAHARLASVRSRLAW
jgi:type II secretory pathway pseudopilin PulG